MALGGSTIASLSDALRYHYKERLISQVNNKTLVAKLIGRLAPENFASGGKAAYIQMETSEIESFGAVPVAQASFRTADSQTYDIATVPVKLLSGTILIPEQSLQMTKGKGASAVVDLIERAMKSIVKAATRSLSRQYLGAGGGTLATVASFSSGSPDTVTVDNTRHLWPGMPIQIFDGTALIASFETTVTITKVLTDTTFTCTTVSTPVSGNTVKTYLAYQDGGTDNEFAGMDYLISDSATIQNIDCSANRFWRSKIVANSGSQADLDMKKLIEAYRGPQDLTYDGDEPNMNYARADIVDAYAWKIAPDRRWTPYNVLDIGWKGVEFFGRDLIVENYATPNKIVGAHTDHFVRADLSELEWLDTDGQVLRLFSGSSGYEPQWVAFLQKWGNLAAYRLNGSFKLTNIHGLHEGTYT